MVLGTLTTRVEGLILEQQVKFQRNKSNLTGVNCQIYFTHSFKYFTINISIVYSLDIMGKF